MKDHSISCETGLTIRQYMTIFPKNISILLLFTLLTRITYYMVWPFLAIILTRTYRLTPLSIGCLMSGCAVISVALGMYGGSLSDSFGRKLLLVSGCLTAIAGFAGIALADNLFLFTLCLLLTNVSFSWVDVSSRALMSDLLQDRRRRELALHIRYFTINIAAASGPLIGVIFGLNSQKSTFLLTAFSYIPFLLFILFYIPSVKELLNNGEKEKKVIKMHICQMMRIVMQDRIYLVVLICIMLTYLVCSQIESTVPQYLLMLNAASAVSLITVILVTNAVAVIVTQFSLLSLLGNMTLNQRITIGAAILTVSQILFWYGNTVNSLWWVLITIVFSIAEAILLPNLSVLLDHLAPARYRGAYLGASTLAILGVSLGPFVGGALLEWCREGVFIVMALFCLIVAILILINRVKINLQLGQE